MATDKPVAALRWAATGVSDISLPIAEEVPVALVYNGISHVVMMATPADLEAFAIGFSLSEGIVDSVDEILNVEAGDVSPGYEVRLHIHRPPLPGAEGSPPQFDRPDRMRLVRCR